jgi:peptidoglycan/LPS O-acetylase OafA/YrhL
MSKPTERAVWRETAAARSAPRNPLIDALRGLSILLVVAAHYGLLTLASGNGNRLVFGRSINDFGGAMGYYGVAIFFVISGFLITGMALKRYGRLPQIDFSHFWSLRFSRIMPMLFLCIVSMALFHAVRVIGFGFKDATSLAKTILSLLAFRFHEVLGTDPAQGVWSPLWSLSVEEMFYLAFPFACLCLNGRGALVWAMVLIMASATYFHLSGYAGPYSFLGCMHLMALGCLLALCRPERLRERLSPGQAQGLGLLLCAGAVVVFTWCILRFHPIYTSAWSPLLCGAGAGAVLVASSLLRFNRPATLILSPLTILGVVSYELYLIYWPWSRYVSAVGPMSLWWTFLLAVAAAILVHHGYAEPMNRLLREFFREGPAGPEAPEETARRPSTWAFLRQGIRLSLAPLAVIAALALGADWLKVRTFLVRIDAVGSVPAGLSEPLAGLWRSGVGDMVFLRHEEAGKVRIGIAHWGRAPELGAAWEAAELAGQELQIEFRDDGVVVSANHLVQVRTGEAPYFRYGLVRVATGDEGFADIEPQATSRFHRIR